MARGTHVIGIDLGGTNMQIGVVSPTLKVVGRAKKKTRAAEGSQRVMDRLIDGVQEACADAKIPLTEIAAVGIGAPGAVDPKRGIVLEATNLRWNDFPLASVLGRRLGQHVVVDNDVNCAIYGEFRLGAAKGHDNVLGVWIGTGIGGGLILNGSMFYGATHTAGEIGHTTLFPAMPPGSRSLENNCSRTAIVDRMVRLIRANNPSAVSDLAEGDLSDIKARIVTQAYIKNDKVTRNVVDNAADMLGISVANAVTLLGLQRVVIGGGLTEAMGENLVGKIRESARRHAFPEICRNVEVVATKLEADAGLLGAAMFARDWLERTTGRKFKVVPVRRSATRSPSAAEASSRADAAPDNADTSATLAPAALGGRARNTRTSKATRTPRKAAKAQPAKAQPGKAGMAKPAKPANLVKPAKATAKAAANA